MVKLIVVLHLLAMRLLVPVQHAEDILRRHRDQRGSVTIEQVIWAVALIGIAAIVVGAITTYVKTKSGQIK